MPLPAPAAILKPSSTRDNSPIEPARSEDVDEPLQQDQTEHVFKLQVGVQDEQERKEDEDVDEDVPYEGKSFTLRDILVRAGEQFDILRERLSHIFLSLLPLHLSGGRSMLWLLSRGVLVGHPESVRCSPYAFAPYAHFCFVLIAPWGQSAFSLGHVDKYMHWHSVFGLKVRFQ